MHASKLIKENAIPKYRLCPLYVNAFNKIFDTGVLSCEWQTGLIVLLYRNKGDLNNGSNYMVITLFSCKGKLFTYTLP